MCSSSSSSSHASHATMNEDTLAAMFRTERSYTPTSCLPHPYPFVGRDAALPVPNAEWRSKICDWSYRVVDHFRYDREVVSISMNLFDRFLISNRVQREAEAAAAAAAAEEDELDGMKDLTCSPKSCSSSESSRYTDPDPTNEDDDDDDDGPNSRFYQLSAMTALYLSIKLHAENGLDNSNNNSAAQDNSSSSGSGQKGKNSTSSTATRRKKRRVKLLSFVELSRGQFLPEDIAAMERTMLDTLNWRLNPPTPTSFVSYLLKILPTKSIRGRGVNSDLVLHVLHELSRYLTELSVCLSDAATLYRPSAVAYAAVLIAMDTIRTEALPLSARAEFIDAVTRLSSESSTSAGMQGEGQDAVLTPHSDAVRYLVGRIRTSFLPEMLLDAASCPNPTPDGEAHHGHPIAIAREAGLLNVDSLRGLTGFDVIPSPPSSGSFTVDDDDDDEADDSTVTGEDEEDDEEMYHRRGLSATSVLEDLAGCPRRMVVTSHNKGGDDSWRQHSSSSGIEDDKLNSRRAHHGVTDHGHQHFCHRIAEDAI